MVLHYRGGSASEFFITHVSAFDILNPRAADVGAKKSNGEIWTQYNFRMCTAAPSPQRKSGGGGGRTLFSESSGSTVHTSTCPYF